MLAWQPGQPEPRVVTVNVKDASGMFKGEVDLAARKVLCWAPASGQTMILLEEFLGAMDVALADPRMQEGLQKRGLTKDQVFCIPLTAGAFGEPEEQGRRLMKVPCLVSPTGSNFYAKPIEGLFAVSISTRRRSFARRRHRRAPGPGRRLGLHRRGERRPRRRACAPRPTPSPCPSPRAPATGSTAAR